jgi:hypothetical protein
MFRGMGDSEEDLRAILLERGAIARYNVYRLLSRVCERKIGMT